MIGKSMMQLQYMYSNLLKLLRQSTVSDPIGFISEATLIYKYKKQKCLSHFCDDVIDDVTLPKQHRVTQLVFYNVVCHNSLSVP